MVEARGGQRSGAGRKAKPLDEHQLAGTYRADRHGPLVESPELCARPAALAKSKCGRPKKWARSPADELAIKNGCWFDERRAAYVVDWFREHLQLSDSEWAGQPFELQPWQRDEIIYPLYGWMRKDEKGRIVRRFNRTYIEIPKKNGKSTLASGIGLHQLVGEGSRGNEVYSAATDKDQASIVHGEAIRMVESSPKLSAFLKVNYTTRHIYNRDIHATYKAIASRPAGSEGLKGNTCIIDELHAWYGDELWNALRYMGVNWPERLIFVITTAGDDPESVCYRQYELAKAVENGEIANDRLLVCIHEAGPDDDIEDEAVQRKANPSLGHTILKDDLEQDIEDAKKSLRTLAVLKRYRFNVWTTVSDPWIDPQTWADAKTHADNEDLIYPAWCGLDLARKSDMTALAMLFDRGDDILLKCHFWLPRPTAEKWSHLAPYADWEKAGYLTLMDSEVAEYHLIEADIVSLIQSHDVRGLAYDEKYAEEITQRIVEQTFVERVAFPQTIMHYAGPCASFDRLLAGGELKHDGNRLLTWQAGNVQVKADVNNNIRPVKEKRGSHKSIDGIVAAVMGLGVLMESRLSNDWGFAPGSLSV